MAMIDNDTSPLSLTNALLLADLNELRSLLFLIQVTPIALFTPIILTIMMRFLLYFLFNMTMMMRPKFLLLLINLHLADLMRGGNHVIEMMLMLLLLWDPEYDVPLITIQ